MSLRDFIIDKLFDKSGKLSNKAETKCKNKYPDMHEQIMGEWSGYKLFTDKCHAIIHGKAKTCKMCGNYISYGWLTANNIYCSKKCRASDRSTIYQKSVQTHIEKYGDNYKEVIQEKMKQTCLDRYGVDNPMKSEEVKNRYQSPFDRADVREKIKKTLIEKYGVDNPMKTDDVKAKVKETLLARYGGVGSQSDIIHKKVEETTLARYGVRNVFESDIIKQQISETVKEKYGVDAIGKSDIIREKIESTCLNRYGASSPLASEDIRLKIAQTNIEKYGVDNPMKTDDVRAKAVTTIQARYGTTHYAQSDEYKKLIEERRREYVESLGLEYCANLLIGPTKYGMVSKECIKAQLDGNVTHEMLVSEFSDYHRVMKKLGIEATGNITTPHQILIDWLNEIGVEFTVNDRQVIKPKELDIYIPSHNLGIEINGLYWHSAVTTDRQHIDKFNMCRAAGIKLLQFTDRDIIERPELVKGIILSKLGLLSNKIMARKCRIVGIGPNNAQRLLERWHYQGRTTNAAKFIGLDYNNRIVAIIGYTMKGAECRIERFACELNTNVVGGYSKLENAIIKSHDIATIVTFSLGLISDGDVYAKNGYITTGYASKPEWYVTDYKNLYNRQRFMKNKLHKLFGDKFDPTKTERENILLNGYRLYFGAGITKWTKEVEYTPNC